MSAVIAEIPTRVGPMRETIILALARLRFAYPEDRGYMKSDVQNTIFYTLVDGEGTSDYAFTMESRTGKAFDRAFDQLLAEGIVVRNPDDPNNIEFTLAIYEVAE